MSAVRRFFGNLIFLLRRRCRILLRQYSYKDPAFKAVTHGNLSRLRKLIESGKINANLRNVTGRTLLIDSILNEKVEIFDYLSSLEDIDLDLYDDCTERTPLLYAGSNEYFTLELIRKGANVSYECDPDHRTILHYYAAHKINDQPFLKIGQLVIQKGVDINAQDCDGYTALSYACQKLNVDWICMLLYYEADVTIHTNVGLLPLFLLEFALYSHLRDPHHDQKDKQQTLSNIQFLQDVVFDYTFDNIKTSTTLENLIVSMKVSPTLFYKTLEYISDVDFTTGNLDVFITLIGKELKFLSEKFNFVLKEIVDTASIFSSLIQSCRYYEPLNLKMIIDIFLETEFVSDFIQNSEFELSFSPISTLIRKYKDEISLDEITTQIFIMLSYGLEVRSIDLTTVHKHHGHCPLFKFLLSMDIIKTDLSGDYSVPIDLSSVQSSIITNAFSIPVPTSNRNENDIGSIKN